MIKTKQDRILNTFDAMFPDARCVLNHSNNLELLVAVMLSAQTTDEAVNKLTTHLFKKYQNDEHLYYFYYSLDEGKFVKYYRL